MKNETIAEKKKLIFKALFELIKKGRTPETIKVSDIAAAADIGKGTVYQYFESKEQIIAEALIYHIKRSFISITERMHRSESFEGRINALLNIVEQRISLIPSSIGLLFFDVGVNNMKEYLNTEQDKFEMFHAMIAEEMDELARVGIREGVVDADIDFKYARQVFGSAMMGYFSAMCRDNRKELDVEALKKHTLKMILQSCKA